MKTVVLIPAYDPDEKLPELVRGLKNEDFEVLIVNDGSRPDRAGIFDACRESAAVTGYEENHGKGYALKYGMRRIREFFPETEHFITADADGQHSIEDICRVRKELQDGKDFVLTMRRLSKDAPFKSRLGNMISRFMFAIANAHYLPDNQSGLRGFHVKHVDWMLNARGDKYDYEMNIILLAEKQGIKIAHVPIRTIYFNDNEGTHFKPLADTALIYRRYFETNIFAVIAIVLNLILVILSTIFFNSLFDIVNVIIVNWGVHALLCFVIERYTLFKGIKYTPGSRRLIISIFRYTVYGIFCAALWPLKIPFVLTYIFVVISVTVGEYFVLKVSYE